MTVTVIDSVSELVKERDERLPSVIFNDSENVSFDIETTGLSGKNDIVTVIGLYPDENDALMMLNKDRSDVTDKTIADNLEDHTSEDMYLLTTDSELDLLEKEFKKFCAVFDMIDGKQRLIGYNADTWSNGFDWPFIRTRLNRNNIRWYVGNGYDVNGNISRDEHNIYYSDIFFELKSSFNNIEYPKANDLSEENVKKFATELGAEIEDDIGKEEILNSIVYTDGELKEFIDRDNIQKSFNGLDESHEIQCSCETKDVFDDSYEAVTNYENENFASVVAHCYYDVKRTLCLLDIVLEYSPVSKESDLKNSGFL